MEVATLALRADTRDLERGVASLKKLGAEAELVEKKAGRVSGAVAGVGSASRKSANDMRMISLQLSQVAQQGAVTGNYLQALAIQLPDMALGFGTIGIAAGVAAGALLPLAVNAFAGRDALGELDGALEGIAVAAKDFHSIMQRIEALNRDVADGYREQATALRDLLGLQASAARADIQKNMKAAVDALAASYGDLGAVSAEAFDKIANKGEFIRDAAEELRKAQASGNAARLAELQAEIIALGQLPNLITDISIKYGVSADEAERLLVSVREFQQADGLGEQAEAASVLAQNILDAAGSVDEMSEETRAAYDALLQAGVAAAEIAETDMASGIGSAVDEAQRLADALGVSLRTAEAIAALGPQGLEESGGRGGRGGDPREMGGSLLDWQTREGTAFLDNYKAPRARGGGGGGRSKAQIKAERDHQKALQESARIFDQTRTAAEAYARELEDLAQLHEMGYLDADTYNRALQQMADEYQNVSAFSASFKDSIIDAAMGGEDAFDSLTEAIKRASLEYLLFGSGAFAPEGGAFGGLLGGLFGGFRADGGPVSAGRAYVVGERGPELFMPGAGGAIVPNHAMGGNVTQIFNVDAGPGSDPQAIVRALRPAMRDEANTMIARARREGR